MGQGRARVITGGRAAVLTAVLLTAASCAAPGSTSDAAQSDAGRSSAARQVDLSLPAGAPARFGFGSSASAERVALWDIDVRPDGAGLPPGSGSVAAGREVYRTWCVSCHGLTGVEGPNNRLVGTEPWGVWPSGRAVGNYWPYATTLYDYIRKAMPQATPGVLSADETYAVIAYVLNLNGLVPDGSVMDAETLPAVQMPARDRFVVDDRVDGPEIR